MHTPFDGYPMARFVWGEKGQHYIYVHGPGCALVMARADWHGAEAGASPRTPGILATQRSHVGVAE